MVTNQQLYLAIGIPMLFNATLILVLIAMFNAKFEALNARIEALNEKFTAKFDAVDARFDAVNTKFESINFRLDEMRDLWRAELRRVEEILDARLKHLEERR